MTNNEKELNDFFEYLTVHQSKTKDKWNRERILFYEK